MFLLSLREPTLGLEAYSFFADCFDFFYDDSLEPHILQNFATTVCRYYESYTINVGNKSGIEIEFVTEKSQ